MAPEATEVTEAATAYVEIGGEKFYPEEWVQYQRGDGTTEYYVPYHGRDSTGTHVLRGECDATVERDDAEDGECGYSAVVRRVNDSGIEEYCKLHAPEGWLAIGGEHGQVDDNIISLRQDCEKMVTSDTSDGFRPGEDVAEQTAEGEEDDDSMDRPPAVHPCGDHAFVAVSNKERWSKSFCRTHAREDWYTSLHIPTGYVTGRFDRYDGVPDWPDEVDEDEAVWVDAAFEEVYEDPAAWMDGCDGRYADVNTAAQHLVVLDGRGSPVLSK